MVKKSIFGKTRYSRITTNILINQCMTVCEVQCLIQLVFPHNRSYLKSHSELPHWVMIYNILFWNEPSLRKISFSISHVIQIHGRRSWFVCVLMPMATENSLLNEFNFDDQLFVFCIHFLSFFPFRMNTFAF